MPSVSQSQQRLMGMAWAYSKGDLSLKGMPVSLKEKIKDLAGHMKSKDISDFAHTPRKNLPERITRIINNILKEADLNKNFEKDVIRQIETILDDDLFTNEEKNFFIEGKKESAKEIYQLIKRILKNLGHK